MTDKAHILIVDDELGIREIIEDYLTQHRFSVATAENGAEMRRRMAERTPNLVILDLNMPGEDGLTLTRQLRASGNVGIIMLTATAESVDRVVGLEVGADDYIAKPFNLRELVARIHTVLRRLGEGASSPKSCGTLRDAGAMTRKIAAIMAADVASYSRLVAENEEETLRVLAAFRKVFDNFVERYGGRIFNTAGDSVMSEFGSAVEAMRAAIDIQEALRTLNLTHPPNRWLQFRIGITIADVVEHEGDLLGDGVNLAARLESLAEPGGICISRWVHEAVANKVSVIFRDIGEREVKNIPTPVHAFLVDWPGP